MTAATSAEFKIVSDVLNGIYIGVWEKKYYQDESEEIWDYHSSGSDIAHENNAIPVNKKCETVAKYINKVDK